MLLVFVVIVRKIKQSYTMSTVFKTRIGNEDGFLLRNEESSTYVSCLEMKAARIGLEKPIQSFKINKYIPLRYLLVLLRERRLIYKPVTSWEDPYENFFLKEQFVKDGDSDKSYSVSVENLIKGLYGMSWSLQSETDSLWRIYSPDKLSIRITVSVEDLVQLTVSDNDEWDVWVDSVKYKTVEEIDEWLNNCLGVTTAEEFMNKVGESFFIKRDAFVAEKEFRVIINYNRKSKIVPSFLCFEVDPNCFISEFIVDPRLNKYEFDAIRSALVDAGAVKDKVIQSQLYAFKPRKVEMKYNPFWDF